MNRKRTAVWLTGAILAFIAIRLLFTLDSEKPKTPAPPLPSRSEEKQAVSTAPGDRLLEGYGDPSTAPIEDLRKLQRVVTGYFSVIKDPYRFPIGGNADLSAALLGRNAGREVFLSAGHPVIRDGLLTDRWGSPLVVHPEAWRQLGLRSAGPDRIPYNGDDLILHPDGTSGPVEK